jgi:DNA-binding CsgD family transcriptional regulator
MVASRYKVAAIRRGRNIAATWGEGELMDAPSLVTTREAAGRVKRVHLGLRRLGDLASPGVVAAAPSEACRAVGLDRAMLSHVRDGVLRIASASYDHHPEKADRFVRLAQGLQPPLREGGPEHRAAFGQEPVLVRGLRWAAGVPCVLVERTRTRGYVVAPIVVDGVTVGLLHGDRMARGGGVDEFDAELLAVFGDGLAARMQRHLKSAAPAPHSAALRALTRRERQIMALMAEGASNSRIAERLVISEGTVKTHVRHILRKLEACNRTEAVSRYHAFAATPAGLHAAHPA